MKKLLAIITAMAIMCPINAVMAEQTEYDQSKIDFVQNFGVYFESEYDETISRGDFIISLMSLLKKDDALTSEKLYSDVEENDECFDAANNAKMLGIYNELEFRPDDDILWSEAAEMLERAMGYSLRLKSESVMSIASKLKFPSMSASKKLTYGEVGEIFYAAMHAPLMKYDIKGGGSVSLESDEDKTILSEYYDVEIIEGIVTADRITSLYSEDGLAFEGIKIDNSEYGDDNRLAKDYLGYNIRAYVDFSKDEDFGNLVWAEPEKTDVITIDARDIESVSERVTQISYTKDESSRTLREKIDENSRVIYNGRFFADYSAAELMPENGSVELIDNDRDGVSEVVKVWSYETIFVDRTLIADKVIYNAYTYVSATPSIKLDDVDYDIYWDSEEEKFENIKKDQIISAACSKDGKYVRIETSKNSFSASLGGISKADEEITADGKAYEYTVEFEKEYTLNIGQSYIFYLDAFGRVAAMVKDTGNTYEYAYLYSIAYDDSEDTASLKLFNTDGDWVRYAISDSVKLDGKKFKPSAIVDKDNSIYSDGAAIRQIIKLKYDGTRIKEILTASENAKTGEFNKKTQSLNYYGQNSSFSSLFYVNADTVMIGIPSDNPSNTDAYVIAPSLSWDGAYTITAYEYDEYGDTAVITLPVTETSLAKTISNCIILDVTEKTNADNIAAAILRCSLGMFEELEIEIENASAVKDLKKGDLVNIKVDGLGKVISASKLYSWQNDGEKLSSPDNLHSDSNLFGKVVKTDPKNKRIIMNLGGTRFAQPLRIDDAEIIVKKYNVKKNRCDLISINDIRPGDYLIMYSAGSNITSIIKIDNN